jgi:hypothetical protein
VPVLDLANMGDGADVSLFVEGMPRNLGWLVFGAEQEAGRGGGLTAGQLKALHERLRHLHALKDQLWSPDYRGDLVHDLAVAAVDDPLGLYAAADRILERKLAKASSGSAEWQGVSRTQMMGPHLRALVATGRPPR